MKQKKLHHYSKSVGCNDSVMRLFSALTSLGPMVLDEGFSGTMTEDISSAGISFEGCCKNCVCETPGYEEEGKVNEADSS